ncbi:MAG: hypothetical protein QGI18_08185 [Candidatus Marinimicrobia bacterium]|nr:hypothetical protein [Candidatus Neomarinimicrobiota bacterium]
MNTLDYFFLIGDFSVAIILIIGFVFANKNNWISSEYYRLFWVGCVIGASWEFTFLFLGDEFLHSVKVWPYGLNGWPRKLSHSIWDGGIFMVGIYLCKKYLKGPLFTLFNKNELMIMLSWGIFQELLVEYLFNGRVWIYEPLPWNPIIIPKLPGSALLSPGYTLIPQAIWIIAPIIFYFICLKIMKNRTI